MRVLLAALFSVIAPALCLAQGYSSVELQEVRVCDADSAAPVFPDFAADDCRTLPLYEVDPQGRLIWMRMSLQVNGDSVPQDRPLGFFVSGAMSATLWVNGREIGSNGQPGINRASERPGRMDAVLFVPPEALVTGENEIIALMSSHHVTVEFVNPIHYLMIGSFAGPTERILRAYWPSLINLGIFVIAFFVFGLSLVRSEDREHELILTLIALFMSCLLLAETSRGLFGYAYPLHAWRMFAVVAFATGSGSLVLAHVLKRFSGFSAVTRWGISGAQILVTLIIIALTPSYDPKTLYGLIVPITLAIIVLARASWRGPVLARLYLALFAACIISVFVLLDQFTDLVIFYFASALMFLQFFDHASSLVRARRKASQETARAERLEMALDQARLKAEPAQIALTSAGKLERLSAASIVHLQAAGDYVEIHFANGGARLFSASLNEIETRLPETFLRVHRSHIVNTDFVVRLSREASGVGELELSTAAKIPVSRRIMPKVRQALVSQ